jgi:probable rRNA maturation factor
MSHPKENTAEKNFNLKIEILDSSMLDNIPSEKSIKKWISESFQFINSENKPKNNKMELSIKTVSSDEIKKLNKQYRGKDKKTNVLSFPSKSKDSIYWPESTRYHLGDIVICPEIIEFEAKRQKKEINSHWCHIVIHGFLHLFGFDHVSDSGAKEMELLEKKICIYLGFNDPYLQNLLDKH